MAEETYDDAKAKVTIADVKEFLKTASKSQLGTCKKEIEKLLDDESEGGEEGGEKEEEEEEELEERSSFDTVLAKYGISSE